MAHSLLDALHSEYGRAIDQELAAWLEAGSEHPNDFYDMMRYQLGFVDENLAPVAFGERKRLTSLLCLFVCQVLGGSGQDAIRAASAIELLSNWFRIHIDIEERTSIPPETHLGRRQPAGTLWVPALPLWRLWGDPQAINTGDGMFPLAGRAMLEATEDPSLSLALAHELTVTSLSLMEGQHLHLTLESREDVTVEVYLQLLELKHGALSGYSAWVGAVIGNAAEEVRQELRSYGSDLGVARQIHEEITLLQSPSDSQQGKLHTLLTKGHARRRLENALAALRRAHIEAPKQVQLEAFARELVPTALPFQGPAEPPKGKSQRRGDAHHDK